MNKQRIVRCSKITIGIIVIVHTEQGSGHRWSGGGIVGNTESVPGTLNGRQRRGIIVRIRLGGIGTGINAVFTGSRTWRLGKKLINFRFGERNGRVSADSTRKSLNHHIR